MDKSVYFPFYLDRWIAGTRHMTLEQKGMYISILVYIYETRKDILESDLPKILDCNPRTFRRIWPGIRAKFSVNSGAIRHEFAGNLIANNLRFPNKDNGLPHLARKLLLNPDPDPDPEEEKRKTKKSNQKKAPHAASPVVPDGLCLKSWGAYLEHRTAIRARKLKPASIERLQRWLVDQGDEATQAAVVDQTIRNGWTGLFELSTTKTGGKNGADYDRPIRGSADWYAERARKRLERAEANQVLGSHDGVVWQELED